MADHVRGYLHSAYNWSLTSEHDCRTTSPRRFVLIYKLKAFAESVFAKNLSPEALARSLLVKRTAFRHEREVRLLYLEKSNTKHAGGLYRCGVDPHDLIDQIMTDPRLPPKEADALKAEIAATTGYRGEIKRSLLYAPPKGFVVKIP